MAEFASRLTKRLGHPQPQSRADARLFAAVDAWVRLKHSRILRWLRAQEPGVTRRFSTALPDCINDKFTWRKLFDRDPRHVTLTDKLACKHWVAGLGLPLEIPPVLWQGTDAAGIPPELLRERVLVKANHSCGTNLFAGPDGPPRDEVIARANAFLRKGYGRGAGQWGYYKIPRQLFVEPVVGDGAPLTEMKIYTFGRQIERLVHIVDRFGDMGADIWEDHGQGLHLSDRLSDITGGNPRLPLPACAGAALDVSAEIGAHFDHIRVDLLTDGTRFWLGELTVYNLGGHQGQFGHDPAHPGSRAWDLRHTWFCRTPQRGWRESYRRALLRSLEAAA